MNGPSTFCDRHGTFDDVNDHVVRGIEDLGRRGVGVEPGLPPTVSVLRRAVDHRPELRSVRPPRHTNILPPARRARQLWRGGITGWESHRVSLHLGRASGDDLSTLLARCADDNLTYEPAGGSLTAVTHPGLHRHHWETTLHAEDAFDRACDAIRSWEMHRGAGLVVATDGPIAVGTNVAMNAPLPLGSVDVTCRIVAVIDERDRCGFAYGTLSVHPERGEEAFVVRRDDDSARLEVDAISAPAHPVARMVPVVADLLQYRAVRRYLAAIERIVNRSGSA